MHSQEYGVQKSTPQSWMSFLRHCPSRILFGDRVFHWPPAPQVDYTGRALSPRDPSASQHWDYKSMFHTWLSVEIPGLELWSEDCRTSNLLTVTWKWFYLLAIHVWSFTNTVKLATEIYVEIILHNMKDPSNDQFVLGRPHLCQWRVSQHGSKGFCIFWRLLNRRKKYL